MQYGRSRTRCGRITRGLVVALFSLKVLVLCWNAWAFHLYASYDLKHHQERVLDGGVVPRQRAYNGPLYYLPVLPQIWAGDKGTYPLMRLLQLVNVAYISAFYAICVHPNNLLVLLSTACFAPWLWIHRSRMVTWSRTLVVAVVIGLEGLTRPFSVVTIGIFTLLIARLQLGARLSRRGVGRAAVVFAFTAAVAESWWAVRTATLDKPMSVYVAGHDRWQGKRDGFDYWQVSDGLQPGRHSSIKFHYMAYTVAFALVLAFIRVFRRPWVFYAHLGLALAVYFVALPVATV